MPTGEVEFVGGGGGIVRRVANIAERPLSIVEVESGDAAPAHLDRALRTLARMILRHHQNSDPVANVALDSRSFELTVVPDPSAHVNDDEAA